jgi:hypothetical protein
VVYKFDRNRGLTKEEEVLDYAVLQMGEEFWKDKEQYEKDGKEFIRIPQVVYQYINGNF